jgi:DNA-binding transcriptional LysR family regulator
MNQISRIGIFIAVVKNASFAGAARDLGITSSAVSKQIQNLEHELQVKLLNRTTRKVSVTEEGAVFFERAGRALDDLQEAQEQIQELKARPRGSLKISLPFSFGTHYLGPAVAAFAMQYPEVELDVSFDDRVVDIIGDGYDLSVRIGHLKNSSLISRRLASCPFVICASPDYLKKHGTPSHPQEIAVHNVLAYTRNKSLHEWRYKDPNGKEGHVNLKASFKSDTGAMLCEAALAGLGIVILPIFYAADSLDSGQLVSILPQYVTWPNRDIHALFLPNRYLSARLRLFVDHITMTCKSLPWES